MLTFGYSQALGLAGLAGAAAAVFLFLVFFRVFRRRKQVGNLKLANAKEEFQHRAEELTKLELRARSVVEHVIDGIIAIDSHGTVESFNPAAEKIFGYTADEVVGNNVSMLMPEPYHSQHDGYVSNYLRTGEKKIIGIGREVEGKRKDGSTFPMDLAVSEFRLGERRFFVGMVRDITERKTAERTFRFLADFSASLAELIDYESSLAKVPTLAVPFFADWCAVDIAEAEGSLRRAAVSHVDPAKVPLVYALARYKLAGADKPRGAFHVFHSKKSEIEAELTDATLAAMAHDVEHLRILRALQLTAYICVPLFARGKILGVITFATGPSKRRYKQTDLELAEDLSRRAAIALENGRLYGEAREADRRKDEFLAMLAHELRNPLAPIRTGLDLLGMQGLEGDKVDWARAMMRRQLEHMVRLVDDLLDTSRLMRGKIQLRKEIADLAAVVNRGVETARPLIDAQGHELIVSLPQDPVWVEVDPIRIAQVIANLLTNAAKYNDKPGHIWLTALRDGEQAVIRVRDDGIGIDPETLPSIFDLFMQADRSMERSQGGLGIGLTLTHSLVEMHGGSIFVCSEGKGKGAEFVVRLPISAAAQRGGPAETSQPTRRPHPAPPTSRRRVLVVDDNADAAKVLAELASLWNYDVQIALDGVAALQLARAQPPDVVLLDIGLPGINGYEVAAQLRALPEFRGTLLVAMTGYGQEEDRRRSREAGFNYHLVKPVAPELLQELLAQPMMVG